MAPPSGVVTTMGPGRPSVLCFSLLTYIYIYISSTMLFVFRLPCCFFVWGFSLCFFVLPLWNQFGLLFAMCFGICRLWRQLLLLLTMCSNVLGLPKPIWTAICNVFSGLGRLWNQFGPLFITCFAFEGFASRGQFPNKHFT